MPGCWLGVTDDTWQQVGTRHSCHPALAINAMMSTCVSTFHASQCLAKLGMLQLNLAIHSVQCFMKRLNPEASQQVYGPVSATNNRTHLVEFAKN